MNNDTVSREVFDGFSGLGLSSMRGKISCRLDNFRVLADGSLQKREGARQIASLPEAVRGIYAFADGDEEVILAVAGNCLYRITEGGQVLFTSCFDTEEGEVGFFVYGGRLYILDGVRAYRYDGNCTVTKVQGYTPLYGTDWCTYSSYDNAVNEPINYFSPHVRIRYRMEGSLDYAYLGMAVQAIDWVLVDGTALTPTSYRLSSSKEKITFSSFLTGQELEICVTLPEDYYKDEDFCSSTSAAVYESFENSRVFLYGGNHSSRLFVSSKIDASALKQDLEKFPESCGLYFPKPQDFSFGSGQSITAIYRIYDRMMVFFSSSLWMTEPLDEVVDDNVLFSPICNHMGCSAKHAFLMTGAASPISVTLGGIYRWKIDPDFLDECITKRISDEILPQLGGSFFKNAEICYHRGRSELWFRDKSQKNGRIFLYHLDREVWYCFSGISADRLFTYGDGIGFVDGGRVCLFDEALFVDSFVDRKCDIEAVYESGHLDFGGAGSDKRLESAVLVADLHGGVLCIRFGDEEDLSTVMLSEANAASSDIYELRMPTGRFRTAKLTLCAGGPYRQRIYRAELLAQKGKK